VTLTIPNVTAGDLARAIDGMLRGLVAIARSIRRTDRLSLRALRKLECTYNAERDDYHPHFHIAVEGQQAANVIVSRWLKLHPEASSAAQDIRPCSGSALKELFKYFTKLIAKRPDSTAPREVAPAAALDVIFSAMRRRRVFQAMGFVVTASAGQDEDAAVGTVGTTLAPSRRGDSVVWDWVQELHDWIDLETGELLAGYEPTEAFRTMVQSYAKTPRPDY
jgi:hypothetical protein